MIETFHVKIRFIVIFAEDSFCAANVSNQTTFLIFLMSIMSNIIKYCLIIFIIELFSVESAAQKRKVTKSKPKSVLVSNKKVSKASISFTEKTFDFGHIKQNDIVKHDFVFQNIGSKPLEILSCTASCGCTTPDYPFIPIGASEKSSINVTFNSKLKVGHQKPSITVVTNGEPTIVVIYMEGIVE